jgi:hypothetical protein
VVKTGTIPPVRSFRYEVSREAGPGIEAWTLASLRGTPVCSRTTIPRTTDFHGRRSFGRDRGASRWILSRHDLVPGTVVWIRPGRLHRWDDVASVGGTIVLFRPEPATRSAPGGDFAGPIRWSQLSVGLLHIAADHLRREYEAERTETIPNAREVCGRLEVLLSLRSCAQSGTPCARHVALTGGST